MSVIGAPLSITAALGITGFKLAKSASEQSNVRVKAVPVTGQLSSQIDEYLIEQHIGRGTFDHLAEEYLATPGGTLNDHLNKSLSQRQCT